MIATRRQQLVAVVVSYILAALALLSPFAASVAALPSFLFFRSRLWIGC